MWVPLSITSGLLLAGACIQLAEYEARGNRVRLAAAVVLIVAAAAILTLRGN